MLLLDYETFSEAKLGRSTEAVTAAAYAEHPSTEVLCLGWKLNGGPTRLWLPQDRRFHADLQGYLYGDGPIYAWKVGFEWAITHYVMGIEIAPHRWRDIMAAAAYASMPQGLDDFAKAAGLPFAKDEEGKKAMMKLCKPRRPSKNNPATRWTPQTAPEDYAKMYRYCKVDIDVEWLAYQMLKWTPCLAF